MRDKIIFMGRILVGILLIRASIKLLKNIEN